MNTRTIKIAVLGHCDEQFENITQREYLSFHKLQDLKCTPEEYQNNIFAEARAYFCKDLFSDETEFVGTVTASWNYKYSGRNKIDNFDKWVSSKILLNEDNIILCANTMKVNAWTTGERSLLRHIGFIHDKWIVDLIKREGNSIPGDSDSWEVPLSNQIIASRSIFLDKREFMCYNIGVLNDEFKRNPELFEMDNELSKPRPLGYLSEFLSVLWYFKNYGKYRIIPNERLRGNWYSPQNMRNRFSWKGT